jgi:pimeloyl-ACP methyl ester carboxylesterase
MVLVAPMIPAPGEAPDDYWTNTDYGADASEKDEPGEVDIFFHDVPPDIAAEAMERERRQSEARMREPWPLKAWPDVRTRVLLCRDDRLFSAGYVRRVSKDRLGIVPDEIDGGHCVALSRPKELAARLESYLSPR